MTFYVLEDFGASDRFIRSQPLGEAELDRAIAQARQRMNSYWSRKGPPGSFPIHNPPYGPTGYQAEVARGAEAADAGEPVEGNSLLTSMIKSTPDERK